MKQPVRKELQNTVHNHDLLLVYFGLRKVILGCTYLFSVGNVVDVIGRSLCSNSSVTGPVATASIAVKGSLACKIWCLVYDKDRTMSPRRGELGMEQRNRVFMSYSGKKVRTSYFSKYWRCSLYLDPCSLRPSVWIHSRFKKSPHIVAEETEVLGINWSLEEGTNKGEKKRMGGSRKEWFWKRKHAQIRRKKTGSWASKWKEMKWAKKDWTEGRRTERKKNKRKPASIRKGGAGNETRENKRR